MNLHKACSQEQYACGNGFCINSEFRCNGNIDCKDFSDEINCSLVNSSLTPNYDREKPPPIYNFKALDRMKKNGKTTVTANFDVVKLIEIHEIDSTFSIQFTLTLTWKDPQIKFNFLKNSETENVIKNDTWSPKIEILNVRRYLVVNEAQINVRKEGVADKNGIDELEMMESFKGSENSLVKKQVFQTQMNCFFDNLIYYPFDTEYCHIDMLIAGGAHDFTNFNINRVSYKKQSNEDVSGYKIIDVRMQEALLQDNKKGVQVIIQLDRDVLQTMLSIYLPTLLMIIINQTSNYFGNEGYFDTIVTVNVTCMMVISALFISIDGSLPPTTTIKLVDIWLLFCLVYPFLVVLVNSYIHYLRFIDDDNTEETSRVHGMSKKDRMMFYIKEVLQFLRSPMTLKTKMKLAKIAALYIIPSFGLLFAVVYFYIGFLTYCNEDM